MAGSSWQSVLPLLLLLACPLMMVFMMRGMGGHGSHGAGNDHAARDHDHAVPDHDRDDAVTRR